MSHPSRVRELKHEVSKRADSICPSHPSRVRELKRAIGGYKASDTEVAPLPGA